MALRYPHPLRRPEVPFGSVNLAQSLRVGGGSTWVSDEVSVLRDSTKSFGFRASQPGSWFLQVQFQGSGNYFNYAEGTFPGGQGSITTRSFNEALQRARLQLRIRAGAAGSVSAFYGGFEVRRA